jgi:hypothetical protein
MPAPQRIITSTLVILSLAAVSASGAAAMSIHAASTGAVGHHASAQWVISPYTGQPVYADVAAPSYSRQDKQVVPPATPAPTPAPSYSRQDKQVVPPATLAPTPVTPAPHQPRFAAPTGGFSLTDAAITTGGVIGLLLLALGSGLVVSRRRGHRAALTH